MCLGVFALVGGIISTIGAVQQAEEDRAMAEFYAEQEAENARLARREAEAIKVAGLQEQSQLHQSMLTKQSSTRSSFAASGVVLGAGSVLDYEADIADAYDSDSRNLQYDIASREWQKKVVAANATDQSNMYRAQEKAAQRRKGTSLLTGLINTGASTVEGIYKDVEFGASMLQTLGGGF